MNLKIVSADAIPCWYELSWSKRLGIILRVHLDFVNKIKRIPRNSPIVRKHSGDFKFSKFSGDFGKDFGFNDSLKFLGEKNNFQEYIVPTPLVKKDTGKKCSSCNGLGTNEFDGDKCLFCKGTGRSLVYDYTEAFAVSATLTILFLLMRFPEIETSCSLLQLMTVQTISIAGPNGGSISGECNREVVDWIIKHGSNKAPAIVSAMRSVWKKMEGGISSFYNHCFQVNLSGDTGLFHICCPGDACEIGPNCDSGFNVGEGEGYEFSPHNIDNPIQQLTLLASLAVLHDLVRKG